MRLITQNPTTLGNMRSLGVRSLAVTCELCYHEAVLSADGWGDAVLVRSFRPRMVCTCCGIVGADARKPFRRSLLATANEPARAGNWEAIVRLRGRDGLRGRKKRGKRRARPCLSIWTNRRLSVSLDCG